MPSHAIEPSTLIAQPAVWKSGIGLSCTSPGWAPIRS